MKTLKRSFKNYSFDFLRPVQKKYHSSRDSIPLIIAKGIHKTLQAGFDLHAQLPALLDLPSPDTIGYRPVKTLSLSVTGKESVLYKEDD